MASGRGLIITGAGGFLAAEVARQWVAGGNPVALVDAPRGQGRIDTLAAGLGGRAVTITADINDRNAWPDVLAQASRAFGSPPSCAALIAGAWKGGKPLHEEANKVWDDMMASNLETVRCALQALLPVMIAQKTGSIVVVGARPAVRPWTGAGTAAYTTSKAAVIALAQAVAAEVVEHGVRINAILPSTMDTPANRTAMPTVDPKTWVALASVAGVIKFLLSDEARDVSGATIPVYGRA